ncbi:ubiquitin-conjugating enzyme E2 W-like [Hydractinia symbiolongicarpus]|uniref:ubiquitin-conjugating enzyme E2 W-like n=1 Tax=Hydractinia symbiolongicarpus TaxID=13093 RepID=UPI00254C8F0D|nr:ubiquitin-conjugating enzyme E2 W-like [Hydractinia symbiolongicarpus]
MSLPPTSTKRLTKELLDLSKQPIDGIIFDSDKISTNLHKWRITVKGAPETLYDGELFQLEFTFGNNYPFDSPQVTFVGENIPIHPHVYTNGHICLSILTEDWTPAMSVTSICLSIVSMLSSCKEKKLPPDNNMYVRTANKNPKKTKWWFHDDKV